ncbi:MAG: methylamine dehydrogenase accessory protein MauD [Alphaproteobacteria bacterium]
MSDALGSSVSHDALVVSNVLLWILVAGLSAVVVALARQVGILYERVAPAGALSIGRGPAVGERAPVVSARLLGGGTMEIGGPSDDGRRTLLFFLSPTCPVCKTLLPVVRRIAREERERLRLVLASDGPPEEHLRFVEENGLRDVPYALSTELGVAWKVPRLPWATLLDAGGAVRSKGLVNSREHLESLLEADALGVASIQDWLAERGFGEDGDAAGPAHPGGHAR